MHPAIYGMRNLGTQEDSTVAGNANKLILDVSGTTRRRSGVQIKNHDATLYIWIKLVKQGAGSPTISSSSNMYAIAPGATLLIEAGEVVDVYAKNSGGSVGTVNYSAQEYGY